MTLYVIGSFFPALAARDRVNRVYRLKIKSVMLVFLYHRERILETSTLSCNEEEEEITKPPTR